MDAGRRLARALNGVLAPLGVRVERRGRAPTIGGRRMSDAAVVAAASRQGLSVGEYLEGLFGRAGRAQAIVARMTSTGAVCDRVRTVCEIGPGSGLYIEHVLRHAPVERYEIYEIERSRSEYLASRFPVIAQPADGETLRDTPSATMDLVHAHGVFVTLDFLTACSYFREIARVTAPGGHAVFDMMTADRLDDPAMESWLRTPLRYPTVQSRDYVVQFFANRRFTVTDEFDMPLLVHGSSKYLILRRQEGVA